MFGMKKHRPVAPAVVLQATATQHGDLIWVELSSSVSGEATRRCGRLLMTAVSWAALHAVLEAGVSTPEQVMVTINDSTVAALRAV